MGFLSGDGDGGSTDLSDIGTTDDTQTVTPDSGGFVSAPEPDTIEVNDSLGGGGTDSGGSTVTQPTGGEHTYDNDSGGQGWDGTSGFDLPEIPTPEIPEISLPDLDLDAPNIALPEWDTSNLTSGFADGVTTAYETWTDSLALGAGFFTGGLGVDLGLDGDLDLPGGDGQDSGGGFDWPEFEIPDFPEFEIPEINISPPTGNVLPEGFLAGWADFLAGSTDEYVGQRFAQIRTLLIVGIVGLAAMIFLSDSESST